MDFIKNALTLTNSMDAATAMLAIVMVAYALGDFASYKTKAYFSMIFVTGFILLFGFWFGIPKNVFDVTVLGSYAMISLPLILIHMGSMMKLNDIKQEWRTVVVAASGLVALTIGLYVVASPILGSKVMALTAAGPISGGIVATIIVQEAAAKVGLEKLAVFATLLLVLQNFVGLPIASICLRKEARSLLHKRDNGLLLNEGSAVKSDPEVATWPIFPKMRKEVQTPFILLAKAIVGGVLALYLAQWYNGFVFSIADSTGMAWVKYFQIHKLVMSLVVGIMLYEVGFLEYRILDKANASGYAFFFCLILVFVSLPKAEPKLVMELLWPIVVAFTVAVFAIILTTWGLSKLVGYSWAMCTAIAVTCLFGFPGTYIITDEVTTAVCPSPEDKQFCMDHILPKMLIGGFVTVTIGSVVLAGTIAQMILNSGPQ